MKVHCLFEQSGTFKKAFEKYGYEAYDYDIQNEFNETDKIIDLFEEKPTQYWFVNCKPKNNLIFEPLEEVPNMQIEHVTNDNPLKVDRKTVRSMIHPQYADRFVRQYILDEKEWKGGG